MSGGQRQRICIARAAYEDSEVVLLDDPLSAVDALVGHHLLQNCILSGPLAERTRILVTHHLDVLPQADLVLVMDRDDNNEAHIVQQGTYLVSHRFSDESMRFDIGFRNSSSKTVSSAPSLKNLDQMRHLKPLRRKRKKEAKMLTIISRQRLM